MGAMSLSRLLGHNQETKRGPQPDLLMSVPEDRAHPS